MPGKDDTKMLMLIDALRSGVPMIPHDSADDAVAEPPSSAVQRAPGHAAQTASAYAAPDDSAQELRPGEVVLPTSYYDTALHKMPHQSGLPDPYDVYGAPQVEMQHLPDVTTHMDPAEMQRLPPMTVHPSMWQKLFGGRAPNAPGVRQAGDESAGY